MKHEKTPFKESRLYPIVFMMIITIIFVGILAVFYHSSKGRVQQYQDNAIKKAILLVFSLPTDHIEKDYELYIRESEVNKMKYYQAVKDSVVIGNAFIIQGKGLWGGITGLIAYTPDYQNILRFSIINQNETPGLGARITEKWFTDQFNSKKIIQNNQISDFMMVAENKEDLSETEVKQVTGATASSKAVLDMITKESQRIIQQIKGEL
ncbi:MAG: FMN-binding protein [Candidatus Cloacimonetes bacterium]|nr:FMN-binding protein [Candidatus Cloacimonadota bacterium]